MDRGTRTASVAGRPIEVLRFPGDGAAHAAETVLEIFRIGSGKVKPCDEGGRGRRVNRDGSAAQDERGERGAPRAAERIEDEVSRSGIMIDVRPHRVMGLLAQVVPVHLENGRVLCGFYGLGKLGSLIVVPEEAVRSFVDPAFHEGPEFRVGFVASVGDHLCSTLRVPGTSLSRTRRIVGLSVPGLGLREVAYTVKAG